MKKNTLFTLLLCISALVSAQDITFTFQNARNTNDGMDDFYEADIYMASSTDFKLGSGQIYFTYNTAAFGENIDGSGNFEYLQPDGSILAETYSNFPAYQSFIANDNTSSRVSTSFQQGLSSGTITADNVTTTAKHLFSIKIKYEDIAEEPMIAFETGSVFLDQFFTACGPATFGFPDCTNSPGVQLTNDTFDSSGAEIDTTAPVITLVGAAAVTVEAGTTYTDAGATATDNADGDITADIVIVNPVDTSVSNIYMVTYNVSDAAGNAATEVTREVTVSDTTAPVITLTGDAAVTVEAGTTYTDAGATAFDSLDGDITIDIAVVNPVDTAVPGIYTITYNVSDAEANDAVEVTREVTVSDTTVPVITLTGDAAITVEVGTTYTDAGATAADSFDGDITADIVTVNPVDTAMPGVYTVTYNVSDAAGNAAAQVTREVTVADTTVPVITLTGDATVTIELGTMYTDSGATATDNIDGDITADIVLVNSVNTNAIGSYTVTYNVSDNAGNNAVEVIRTVIVEDTTDPTVSCRDFTVTLNSNGSATITASDIDNGSSDLGGIASLSLDTTSFNCADVDANPSVTLTVTDNSGNSATCVADITVLDTSISEVVTQEITVFLDDTGNVSISANDIDNGSSDVCGIDTISIDITAFDCTDIGANTVTLTVTDLNGNSDSDTAIVVVIDGIAPEFNTATLPSDIDVSFNNGTGDAYILEDFTVGVGFSDNCELNTKMVSIGQNPVAGTELAQGDNTITLTVDDGNGNDEVYTFTVTVAPLLGTQDNDIEGLSIYPNPTQGMLYVNQDIEKVILYTVQGQKVLETSENKLDMSHFETGVYFMQISSQKGTAVRRIVKN